MSFTCVYVLKCSRNSSAGRVETQPFSGTNGAQSTFYGLFTFLRNLYFTHGSSFVINRASRLPSNNEIK